MTEPAVTKLPGRIPPHSRDAERSLLGGLLFDADPIDAVLAIVTPPDFYGSAERKVFEAMVACHKAGTKIDRVTVKDRLSVAGLEAVGGEEYVDLLDKIVPTASNLTHYAKIIRDKSMARQVIEAASAIAQRGYEQGVTGADYLGEAENRILAIGASRTQHELVHVKGLVAGAFKRIESRYERQESVTGISSHLADLDRYTGGFQPGDLILLAARPSMGKTAFANGIALHVGSEAMFEQKKCSVALYSLEMPKEQLVERLLSSAARVDGHRIRTGALIDSDWAKLAQAAGLLADAGIYIDDSSRLTPYQLRASARAKQAQLANTERPLRLVIVDYLQLMHDPDAKSDTREQEVSSISRQLKALAKDLGVPVIALSQLNRALEKRPDKRPQMSDLRESGSQEQDSDLILFLYREEVYDKEDEEVKGIAEIILGKQRNGPIGTVKCAFIHEYTRFENLAAEPFKPPSGPVQRSFIEPDKDAA